MFTIHNQGFTNRGSVTASFSLVNEDVYKIYHERGVKTGHLTRRVGPA